MHYAFYLSFSLYILLDYSFNYTLQIPLYQRLSYLVCTILYITLYIHTNFIQSLYINYKLIHAHHNYIYIHKLQ